MKVLRKKATVCTVFIIVVAFLFTGCGSESGSSVNYNKDENWAMYGEGGGEADLFFVCPTVDMGSAGNYNMSLDDEETKASFVGATKMELGIYNENAAVYVPYYRQVTFPVYYMTDEEAKQYFDIAYSDVKASFEYYLKRCD